MRRKGSIRNTPPGPSPAYELRGATSAALPSPFTQSPKPPEGSPLRHQAETTISGACTAFDWEHLTPEAYEAAVTAEMEAPGTGVAVVKAASQDVWRAKRKGAVNE
jgi:hypothetical protein